MSEKTLNTRILLKYDTYANWTLDNETTQANKTGANFVLKRGEIGICAIEAARTNDPTVQTPTPTVLFKVGDGTSPFKNLKWASALAADVYGWAKASDVRLNATNKSIEFVGTDTSVEIPYMTESEVKDITDPLTERIADLEAKFTGNDSVDKQFENLDGRLDAVEAAVGIETDENGTTTVGTRVIAVEEAIETLTGTDATDGSVAKALKDAKDYADGLASNYDASGTAAEVADDLAEHVQATGNVHSLTKADIGLGNVDNKSVSEIKTELSGEIAENNEGFVTGGKVHTAVEAAKTHAENEIAKLTVEGGAVYVNTQNIADLQGAVGEPAEGQTAATGLYGLIADEATARSNADDAIIDRLEDVEAFFHTAEGETLDSALDTLKEIQDYLNGDGAATGGIIGRVADLEDEFKANGRVTIAEGDITTLKTSMAAAEGEIDELQSITKSYLAKGEDGKVVEDAIKTDVDAAKQAAQDAQDDADAANLVLNGTNNDGLVARVGALESTIGDADSGLVADNEANKQAIADLQDVVGDADDGLVKDVAALQVTVGDDDSGLVKDVAALQAIVSAEGGNSNAQLRTDIGELQTKVNDASTGLAKTYEIADAAKDKAETNATNIATIQQNGVTSDGTNLIYNGDIIFFDCGGSGVE